MKLEVGHLPLSILEGITESHEYYAVSAKMLAWRRLRDAQVNELDLTVGDLKMFRAAVAADPVGMLDQLIAPSVKLLYTLTRGMDVVAKILLEAVDTVIDCVETTTLEQWVLGGMVLTGRLLQLLSHMANMAAQHKLQVDVDMVHMTRRCAEELGKVRKLGEPACQAFLAWVEDTVAFTQRIDQGLCMQQELSLVADAQAAPPPVKPAPSPVTPALIPIQPTRRKLLGKGRARFTDAQAIDILAGLDGDHHA